jgi:hypothetical protein
MQFIFNALINKSHEITWNATTYANLCSLLKFVDMNANHSEYSTDKIVEQIYGMQFTCILWVMKFSGLYLNSYLSYII